MSNNFVDTLEEEDKEFVGEFEVMDLEPIRDNNFMVAISNGDRGKGKFICTSLHGPYDFYSMLEEVGNMWENNQHHAKVYICQADRTKAAKYLCKNTIDYIEAHYADLLTESLIDGSLLGEDYTCIAKIVEDEEGAIE